MKEKKQNRKFIPRITFWSAFSEIYYKLQSPDFCEQKKYLAANINKDNII